MVGNPSPSQLVSPRRVVPCTQHGVRGGAELRWALSYLHEIRILQDPALIPVGGPTTIFILLIQAYVSTLALWG